MLEDVITVTRLLSPGEIWGLFEFLAGGGV